MSEVMGQQLGRLREGDGEGIRSRASLITWPKELAEEAEQGKDSYQGRELLRWRYGLPPCRIDLVHAM